jgi:DNA-damage-inducible protein J
MLQNNQKTMNSTIQIRIDKKMKKDADKTFKDMGLDMSSGIKLFLHQVVMKRALPFVVRTANGFTPEQEKRMIRETEYALKYGKSYTSIEELHNDIMKSK